MAISDYADFIEKHLHKGARGRVKGTERKSRNRLLVTLTKDNRLLKYRILMFAVGGSGRGQANERRVEITSTYNKGLRRDADYIDVVLGIERDRGLFVGIDAARLTHGGATANASTFVYSDGFAALNSKSHDVIVNPSKLITDEHQVYMKPNFLIQYLIDLDSLHRLGVVSDQKTVGALLGSGAVSPDDSAPPAAGTKLSFEEQVRLAMLKMEVGQAGERSVLSRERRRLTDQGHPDLSTQVGWISQTQPYVGFDITSFAADRAAEVVEVKSSTGKLRQFHFSNNELRIAEKRRESYRIVCVSNALDKPTFHEIRNPVKHLEDGSLEKVPDGYLVKL